MELKYYQSYICIVYINNCTNSCTNMEVETAIFVQACVIRDPSPTPHLPHLPIPFLLALYGQHEVEGAGGGTEFHHNSCYLVYVPIFYHICVYGSSCNHLQYFWPPSFSFSSSFFVRKEKKKPKKENFMNCRTQTTYWTLRLHHKN